MLGLLAFSLFLLPPQTDAQGTGTAPDRPTCTEGAPCGFNETNGLEGARVVLFDPGGGHGASKQFLREALTRLSNKYGFILDRRNGINDLTDSVLSDAKVIIYSSTDGNVAGNIPNATVRERVEHFVQEKGWGLLMIHAACAFIDSWPFLQDACIQQYYHHNSSGTPATLYVEDRTVDGEAHGRANPYTSFLLEGLPDRANMRDEWHSCLRDNPRTTHQYDRESFNKIMLTALDEKTFQGSGPCREDISRDGNLYVAWTHTMGNGIVVNNNYGHDNIWAINDDDYGEELLGRYLRYVAKDWGPVDPNTKVVCRDERAVNYNTDFDPDTEVADSSVCVYQPACKDPANACYVPDWPGEHDASLCCVDVKIAGSRSGDFLVAQRGKFKVYVAGQHHLKIIRPNGEVATEVTGRGPKEYTGLVNKSGVYFLKLSQPGQSLLVRKLLIQ